MTRLDHTTRFHREGLVMLIIISTLIVTMGVSAGLVKITLLLHQNSQRLDERLQVEALASSFLKIGIEKTVADPEYQGEEMVITPEQWNRAYNGFVQVKRDSLTGELSVTAECRREGKTVQKLTQSVMLPTADETL